MVKVPHKYVIDRFEKGYAVLEEEGGKLIDMPAAELPEGAKEGDALLLKPDGNFIVDETETRLRAKRADELFNNLL